MSFLFDEYEPRQLVLNADHLALLCRLSDLPSETGKLDHERRTWKLSLQLRHLHTVFYLNSNGQILWQLGGKNSSFSGNGKSFAWQHYVRFRREDGLSAVELSKKDKRYISLFSE